MYEAKVLKPYKHYILNETVLIGDCEIIQLVLNSIVKVTGYQVRRNPRSNRFRIEIEGLQRRIDTLNVKLNAFKDLERKFGKK